jgi:hypothetical protein
MQDEGGEKWKSRLRGELTPGLANVHTMQLSLDAS